METYLLGVILLASFVWNIILYFKNSALRHELSRTRQDLVDTAKKKEREELLNE